MYSRLDNGAAGVYRLYNTGNVLVNDGAANVTAGTDQSLVYAGIRHVF
ncbi:MULTISPECIES: hypothetical protein [Ramlibacter]|nr:MULTISPECIES: hypothetical protein [Ramlibacter]